MPLRQKIRQQRRRVQQVNSQVLELETDTTAALTSVLGGLAEKADVVELANVRLGLGQKADVGAVAALNQQVAAKANVIDLPIASNVVPPAVADAGAVGDDKKYALANHTHKSSVSAARIMVTGASGVATWSFPAMTSPPIVTATANTPAGASYINVASVVEGSITTTQATIQVVRINKTQTLSGVLTSLLGAVLSIFGSASAATYVDVIARRPS